MNQRIYLSPPHMSGREMKYIQEAFDTNWIAPMGPNVDAFEKEFCNYVGVKSGLALSSGTAGIHLALKYLGVGPGDYVFCSSFTFIASCSPIIYQNAVPVFIDSEPESWNMSPEALEKAFHWAKKENKMPKAVIIVDFYGQSADYEKLLPICRHYGVPVIEDAAEALGATYGDKKCGSFGDINVFSFNGNKIITTSGGGMIVTEDEDAVKKMYFWATQAQEVDRRYEHREIGFSYRMSNICAGIGRGQLEVLDERLAAKKKIKERYQEGLKDLPIKFLSELWKGTPNNWLTVFTIIKDFGLNPKDIIDALEKENIEARPLMKPMNMQPVFKSNKFFSSGNGLGIGQKIFERGVCLPSGTAITADEQSRAITIVRQTFLK